MKKLTLAFGYLSLICIILFPFFKCCNNCEANILLIAAAVLFSLGYAPLLFIQRNKTAGTKLSKGFNLLVLVTMLIAGCAVITRNFHYSCGIGLACATYTLIILIILIQIINAIKEKDPAVSLALHGRSIVMGLVLALFVMVQIHMLPARIMDEFDCVSANQKKEMDYYHAKAKSFFDNFDKTTPGNAVAEDYYRKAVDVMAKSDSLVQYIKSVGEEMIFKADKQKIVFDSMELVRHKADRRAVCEILYKEKKDSLLNARIMAYTSFIMENTNSRGKEVIDVFFPSMKNDTVKTGKTSCTPNCKSGCNSACRGGSSSACRSGCGYGAYGSYSNCGICTLICQLTNFNADILHIRMLQTETLNYLQTMQAKALMKEDQAKK